MFGQTKSQIAGWVLSAMVAALMIGPSAMSKILPREGKEAEIQKLGYTVKVMQNIGFVEIVIAVLFMIPRTSFIGAILVAAYLGGATEVHVRGGEPFFMPILIGIVAWVGLGLRDPRIFRLAFVNSPKRE